MINVITVDRESGSGSPAIARKIADRLRSSPVDHTILPCDGLVTRHRGDGLAAERRQLQGVTVADRRRAETQDV